MGTATTGSPDCDILAPCRSSAHNPSDESELSHSFHFWDSSIGLHVASAIAQMRLPGRRKLTRKGTEADLPARMVSFQIQLANKVTWVIPRGRTAKWAAGSAFDSV